MQETFLAKKAVRKMEQEWLTKQISLGIVCQKCSTTKNLTYDHIVPKQLLSTFGYDIDRYFNEDNSMVLCQRCNNFKAGRLDFWFPKTKALLLSFIERI